MSLAPALVSSNVQNWTTPNNFWNLLDNEFHFELDVAAQKENTKCAKFLTKEDDALVCPWYRSNWLNPPYGDKKSPVKKWVEKAYNESLLGKTTVMLLPINKQDQLWFHKFAIPFAEIRIVVGRINFVDAITGLRPYKINKKGKKVKEGNSQGSMLIIFGPDVEKGKIKSYDWKKLEKC